MAPNVPPKTADIRKRRWGIGAGLMIVATVSLLLVPLNGSTHEWIRIPNPSVAPSQD